LKIAVPESLHGIISSCGLEISKWQEQLSNIDGRSKSILEKYLGYFNNRRDKDDKNKAFYEKLFFSELFLHYAKNNKGNIALSILTELGDLSLKVPDYISEGIAWLK